MSHHCWSYCAVGIMCQAGCVQHKAGLWRRDQLQPGLLAAWCCCFLFVFEFGLQSNACPGSQLFFKNGFEATLTSCHSMLPFLFPKVPPPILLSWKRLWLLSNSECEPKAGHSVATPPSARISIDKVTCCSLTPAANLGVEHCSECGEQRLMLIHSSSSEGLPVHT